MLNILNDCSITGDVYSCVRVGCKLQLGSYGSKHALKCLSDKLFVRTYCTHILKTTGCI